MTVIDKATESFPDTTAADWRMVGLAAVHKSVTPRDNCRFLGPAVLRGGYFHGGEFHGGVFHGGKFSCGYFHGGYFRGGVFYGGYFHGGVFHGGDFHGGVFTVTPVQLFGVLPWIIVVQGEGDGRIAIGCECHSMADWFLNGEVICWKHKANWTDVQAALAIVENLIQAGSVKIVKVI